MTTEPAAIRACPACGSDNVVYNKKTDSLLCKDCGEMYGELEEETEDQYEKASDVI